MQIKSIFGHLFSNNINNDNHNYYISLNWISAVSKPSIYIADKGKNLDFKVPRPCYLKKHCSFLNQFIPSNIILGAGSLK